MEPQRYDADTTPAIMSGAYWAHFEDEPATGYRRQYWDRPLPAVSALLEETPARSAWGRLVADYLLEIGRELQATHRRAADALRALREREIAEASEEVLRLLREGLHLQARDSALRAAQQFPSDSRIRRLAEALDSRNKARVNPNTPRQPDRTQDFAWLRNPPGWARGKWVALAGGEVVAVEKTLAAVQRVLSDAKLPEPPLVHRVD